MFAYIPKISIGVFDPRVTSRQTAAGQLMRLRVVKMIAKQVSKCLCIRPTDQAS